MTLMHKTMIGAWNGVEVVQQGFPSQQGGPRLIRFESPRWRPKAIQVRFEPPRWRPKAIQVRVQFGVQEQCGIKRMPRSHTDRFWTFYIWLEAEFHRASHGTGLMPKFVLSQRELSKQVDIHNLPMCCVDSLVGL
jgi:hypothetical protein